MKRHLRLLAALFAATLLRFPDAARAQATDGQVTYRVATQNYNGGYDPKHVAVVWLVDGNNSFVKTLCRHAGSRINYLYKWIADRGSYTVVDGVTSATLNTQPQTHTVTWDCRRTDGSIAPDGTYTFRAEYTSSNAQGPYMASHCSFVKGASPVTTNYANYSNASGQFTSLSLTYRPYNEVAVIGLGPSSGAVNTNVALVVSVTNQTLNTLSFSVAVSNTTAGALIGTQPVTALPGRAATNVVVLWNTAGLAVADYSLRAVAAALAAETNTADNAFASTVSLASLRAGDLAITRLEPSAGVAGLPLAFSVSVTNKTAEPSGPFWVTLSNRTAAATYTPGSGTWRVAASSDDAEENASTLSVSLTSTDLELTVDSANQVVGLRFTGVGIPRQAALTSAHIQFADKTGENLNTSPIALTVRGQAADNPATFTTASANVSGRPDTAASAAWSPPEWADGARGPAQRTPDLSALVQEVVDRPGWTSGNAMAFTIAGSGTGSRRAWSYDGSSANAAELEAAWLVASPIIAAVQVANLAPLAATNLTFVWDTDAVTAGVYAVSAQAGPLANETFTADNGAVNDVTLRDPIRDVAVTAVTPPPAVAPNRLTNVVVAVANLGDLPEDVTTTLTDLSAGNLLVGTLTATALPPQAVTNLVFVWSTATNALFKLGTHILLAEAAPLPGETALGDNTNTAAAVVSLGSTTNVLAAAGSVWKYLDQGLDLSRAPWTSRDYYDGFWAAGPAPLGYGLPTLATAIGSGDNPSSRHTTAYFRREFVLDAAPAALTARVMRADGIVLYLNAREVARQNMPDGPVGYGTFALGAVTGANALAYVDVGLSSNDLVIGRNLLAAELHLASPARDAASFSLELLTVNPTLPAERAFTPTALTPDGRAQSGDAAGVSVTVANAGNVTETCLVLIRDAASGQVLGSQTVGPLLPGETTAVRVTLATFGAATGNRTLQAITVCGGVTNLDTVATAAFQLDAPDFTPHAVAAAGSVGGRCNAVAVDGRTVYLGCGASLEAWDANAPGAPVRTASLRLPGLIEDLDASNGWVYVATGSAGVQLVDASAPSQLVHRATFDSSGHARRVALHGSLLYVADGVGGIRALNVAAPASPALAGAFQTTGPAQTVTPVPPHVLVLDTQRGLQALHAAAPAALSLTGACRQVTSGLALAARSGWAYAADANGGLFRISTAVPTNLTVAASARLPAAGLSLATSGSALYAAAGAQGVLTLDAATLDLLSASDVGGEASDVAVANGVLYVAAGFGGGRSFDISAPLAPAPLGVFATGARTVDAAASGSTLYVAADEAGLQILSLQDLARPALQGSIPSLSNARCVAVAPPFLYVAEGLGGLSIFDVSAPAAPVLRGTYPAAALSHIRRVAVAGNRLALTDGRTIELLSVADPAAPALLASRTPGGFVFDMAAVPGELYAACGGYGLRALRMDTLGLDRDLATPGPAVAVVAVSNRLTVACGPAGWLTLNIDNPANPVQVQATPATFTFDAAGAGPLLYLADGARTAQVMNVSAPLTPVPGAAFGRLTAALRVRAVQGLLLAAEDEAGLAIFTASPGDINLNGVPDEWEQQIVDASLATNGATRSVLDVDLQTVGPNGFTYYQSYLAGLTPTDPNSVLALSAVTPVPNSGGQVTVRWFSVPGKRYTLYKSTDLAVEFTAIPGAIGILADGPETSYTDTVTGPRAFYLVVLAP